jgi:tripartite-type tricarboxylate transporter receptor subunit TctC
LRGQSITAFAGPRYLRGPPVASIWRDDPAVMEVNPSFPAKTVPEFITYAKVNPGRINMASVGIGSTHHVYGELFKMMAGVNMVHVPYRGTGPALTDLMGGQVQVIFDAVASSIAYIKTGKLRPLALTSASRLALLPDVPTVAEFVPGYEATNWSGVGAPRNTPPEIIDRLNKEINAGLADPKLKARIADLGYAPFASSPADFGKPCQRNREVGQGDQVCRDQGGMTGSVSCGS